MSETLITGKQIRDFIEQMDNAQTDMEKIVIVGDLIRHCVNVGIELTIEAVENEAKRRSQN